MATLVFNAEDYVGERATTRTAAGNGGSGSSGNTDALERVDATKTYWRPEHHTDSAAYLRVENWYAFYLFLSFSLSFFVFLPLSLSLSVGAPRSIHMRIRTRRGVACVHFCAPVTRLCLLHCCVCRLKDLEDLTFTGRRNQKPSSSNNNARSKTDSGNINASSASSASAPTSSAHIASRSYHLEADGDYDHEEDEQGLSYRATVPLSYEAGIALLRYFEEVKLFANIADQMQSQSQSQGEVELEADSKSAVAADKAIASSSPAAASRSASTSSSSSSSSSSAALRKPSKDVPALEDAAFFDRHWNEEVLKMWPQSETRRHWLAALVDLEKKLDAAIAPTLRLAPGRRRRSRKNWEEVKEKEEDGATRAANVALAASAGAAISAGGSTTTAAAAGTGGGGGAGAAAGEEEKKNADSSQAIARRGADGAGGGGGGAFVKLSVRSPKDAVFLLSRTQELIRSRLAGCSSSKISWTLNSTSDSPASSAAASVSPSTSSPSSPSPPAAASAAQADFLSQHDGHADAMALTDEVNAIHYACWQAMRCVSGTEVMVSVIVCFLSRLQMDEQKRRARARARGQHHACTQHMPQCKHTPHAKMPNPTYHIPYRMHAEKIVLIIRRCGCCCAATASTATCCSTNSSPGATRKRFSSTSTSHPFSRVSTQTWSFAVSWSMASALRLRRTTPGSITQRSRATKHATKFGSSLTRCGRKPSLELAQKRSIIRSISRCPSPFRTAGS